MARRKDSETTFGSERPIVRDYMIVCLVSLFLIMLLLLQEGLGWWSIVPVLLGAIGILTTWGLFPSLVLACLVVLMIVRRRMYGIPWGYRLESSFLFDVALAMLTLAYLSGAMRLLALVRSTVPVDVRQARRPPARRVRGRWFLPREATKRSSFNVPSQEIVSLLFATPAFVAAAFLSWVFLANLSVPEWFQAGDAAWRLVVAVWAGGIVLATIGVVLAFLDRIHATPEESLLYLQDQLWKDTRGEERRIDKWISWARLRQQAKEERK
jgi:hypothetical protein